MKKIGLIFLISLQFSANIFAQNKANAFKNSVRLNWVVPAQDSCFYALGYQRSFIFTDVHAIDIFGGFGYYPPNVNFLSAMKYNKIGLYAPTIRINYRSCLDKMDFVTGIKATVIRSVLSEINWEDRFEGFIGLNFYLFKKRVVLGTNLGIGQKAYRSDKLTPYMGIVNVREIISYSVLGLDVGFQF